MNETIQNSLIELFETTFKEKVIQIEHIPASASDRRYVRMASKNRDIIGSYNSNKKENVAFVAFTKHFIKKGIAVPAILAENLEEDIYLLEDLGNQTLLQYLNQERTSEAFPASVFDLYKKVVQDLAYLQIKGDRGFDYELCSESQQFDKRAMLYDLNAFQFHFLKVVGVTYNIEKLELDFKRLIKFLTKENCPLSLTLPQKHLLMNYYY